MIIRHTGVSHTGMSNLGSDWARLATNATNLASQNEQKTNFKKSQMFPVCWRPIRTIRAEINTKFILEMPRFVPFVVNLVQFEGKSDIPQLIVPLLLIY